jgi:hypothetical protein
MVKNLAIFKATKDNNLESIKKNCFSKISKIIIILKAQSFKTKMGKSPFKIKEQILDFPLK